MNDITKLTKLRNSATDPLANKFTIIPLDDSDEQIVNNYNLEMRINDLRRHLVQYDMSEVFKILSFPSSTVSTLMGAAHPLPGTIDLLSNWGTISEADVMSHIRFLRNYGQV